MTSLPTAMPFMYSAYCTTTGRSRPRLWWISASFVGVQILPQDSRAGSPGRAKKRKNVTALTTARIATEVTVRRMTKRSTGVLPGWRGNSGHGRPAVRAGRDQGLLLDEDAVQRGLTEHLAEEHAADLRAVQR